MGWTADQIYTLPKPEVIDFFKNIPELKRRIFLVNDLEGIRFDWTRNLMFSKESEQDNRRHGLPQGGLLAIAPEIYKTSYDKDQDDQFWKDNSEGDDPDTFDNEIEKWSNLDKKSNPSLELPSKLDINSSQQNLFGVLRQLNLETSTPIFYYKCIMWGGDIEEEYAIVFDKEVFVYSHDIENNQSVQWENGIPSPIDKDALQKGLGHLGLILPTGFFALHEGSFDWKRYHVA